MTTERTPDDASRSGPPVGGRPRKIGWGALALFLAAFAVFESVKYGLPTTAAALLFFALCDLARLAGVRPPGMLYQAVHRVWIPLVVLIAYSLGPVAWPPLFTAALGWLTRIAVERAFGRGFPLTDGSSRSSDADTPPTAS
ncbi:DUF4260 family protein [Sphaerisporangium sp. NPDC005288]|uniref:DUF4260 family protein n=1 Tax=Sphaerisporangium sp. NPDC005288 TaxID=3155114 RepID=UPI0033A18CE1